MSKDLFITIRISEDEKNNLEKIAGLRGVSVSDYIRSKLKENEFLEVKFKKMEDQQMAITSLVHELSKSIFHTRFVSGHTLNLMGNLAKKTISDQISVPSEADLRKFVDEKVSDLFLKNNGGQYGIQ